MPTSHFVRIGALRTPQEFAGRLQALGVDLPFDDTLEHGPDAPLQREISVLGRTVGNRFAVQPMEGWDGTSDGRPSDLTHRRWCRFGQSGAKLIWGGEAVAVRHDGRANPNQLLLTANTRDDIARLRDDLVRAHREAVGSDDGLLVGLQLTHSGRFARPNRSDHAEPVILYRHPILDQRLGLPDDYPILTDAAIRELVEVFAHAAALAHRCGFDFVDLKHCHGYLGHEFLSAHTRGGQYGGSLENRTRFLRETVEAVRATAPGIGIGVRLSAFDTVPYEPDMERSAPGKLGPGVPCSHCHLVPYRYGFGVDPEQPTDVDLTEPLEVLAMLRELGVTFVNVTAGSPYYSHHIQRPALYPPSDGYQPPEDPLVGVARQMHVTRYLKQQFPDIALVGTAYTYLQEYLPHVAQAAVREGWVDFVGLGRMMLSYPQIASDVLAGRPLQKKRICRTFSDCTTAPRGGLVSGCYPLDDFYQTSEQGGRLAVIKETIRRRLGG